MNAWEPLARVVARSKQLRVDVQHLHAFVAAGVARIGLEKGVKSSPVITPLIAGCVLRFIIHASTLVDSCLGCLARVSSRREGLAIYLESRGRLLALPFSVLSIAVISG
jgi:hypothetical protein